MKNINFFPKNLLVILSFLVILFSGFTPSIHAQTTMIDYVALGDSLAAGQTPYKQDDGTPTIDKGYVNYLTDYLQEQNYEVNLHNYGYSGYTTANIAVDLKTNQEQIDSIKQADVITLNAGANDFLKGAFNPVTKEIDYTKAPAILAAITQNMQSILSDIQTLNPNADIYIMGYYNAFPYLDANPELHQPILLAVNTLNNSLETVAAAFDVTFVPTFNAMERNIKTYVPNPLDIHPNAEGYKTLANEIWEEMKFDVPFHWKEINKNNAALTQNVPLDKTWMITFNTKVDKSTVTNETIFILDSQFQQVPITVALQEDGKTVKVKPKRSYNSNEIYHLYATDGVKSVAGKNLKNAVSMVFVTAK